MRFFILSPSSANNTSWAPERDKSGPYRGRRQRGLYGGGRRKRGPYQLTSSAD
ncbi:MAG TPA: hypothetical protein VII61_07155 [Ktedonobacteraceae bacterium]